jgi:DNA-binding NtrC family response regulator
MVVDDEPTQLEFVGGFLRKAGFEVVLMDSAAQALERFRKEPFDLVLTDQRMPEMSGLELLKQCRAAAPEVNVIIMTAYGSIETAVSAMKEGATDYLTKPLNLEELLLRIERVRHSHQLVRENSELREALQERHRIEGIIGESGQMQEVLDLVRRVAPSDATVLLRGESGTGKEVVARTLHHHSRRSGPFIPVNCGGIPDALLESELFGYERGAFTGAAQRKVGMFELAAAGTLFLDEIGEMPGPLQVKLLRAVQDRRIQRLGATAPIPIETRLLAATNRDLEREVAAGRFREDLYYRLNVVRVQVPPLRERLADLPRLVGRILARLNRTMGRQVQGLTPAALTALGGYGFPGNVRELENILERAVIFSEGPNIEAADLDLGETGNTPPGSVSERAAGTLKENERVLIAAALARWEGNRTRAAAELGITRRTLFNKLRQYGID